jgi:hypothetical protein
MVSRKLLGIYYPIGQRLDYSVYQVDTVDR